VRRLTDLFIYVALLVMAGWAGATWYGIADVGWPIWLVLGVGTFYMTRIALVWFLFALMNIPPYRKW
jgi:hypothetical protein